VGHYLSRIQYIISVTVDILFETVPLYEFAKCRDASGALKAFEGVRTSKMALLTSAVQTTIQGVDDVIWVLEDGMSKNSVTVGEDGS
jgi:hypothetical protein